MACEINKEVAKSIYRLVKGELNTNNSVEEHIKNIWNSLSTSFEGNTHIDQNDKIAFFKFALSMYMHQLGPIEYLNNSDKYQSLAKLYDNPTDAKQIIGIDVTSANTNANVTSNLPVTPPPVVDTPEPEGQKVEDKYYEISEDDFDTAEPSLKSLYVKLYSGNKFLYNAPTSVINFLNEFVRLSKEYGDNKLNDLDFYNKLSDLFNTFVAEYNNATIKSTHDVKTFFDNIELVKLFEANSKKTTNQTVTNIKTELDKYKDGYEFDFANGYRPDVNDAFFNKEYYHSGKHQSLFLAIQTLALGKITDVSYLSMTISKLWEFVANGERFIGEYKGINNVDSNGNVIEKTEIDGIQIKDNVRSFVNMILSNLTKEERNKLYDIVKTSSDINLHEELWKRLCSNDESVIKQTISILESNTQLVFILPFDKNGKPIHFSYNGELEQEDEQNIVGGSYEVNTIKGLGVSSKEMKRNPNNSKEEFKMGLVAFPLHSVSTKREGQNKNEVDSVIENTKKQGIRNVNVTYKEKEVRGYDTSKGDSVFIIGTMSGVKINDNIVRIGTTEDATKTESTIVCTAKQKVDATNIKYFDRLLIYLNGNPEVLNDKYPVLCSKLNSIFGIDDKNYQWTTDLIYQKINDLSTDNRSRAIYNLQLTNAILETFGTFLSNAKSLDIVNDKFSLNIYEATKRNTDNSYVNVRFYTLNKEGIEFFNNFVDTGKDQSIVPFKAIVMPEKSIFSKYSYDIVRLEDGTENELQFLSRKVVYVTDSVDDGTITKPSETVKQETNNNVSVEENKVSRINRKRPKSGMNISQSEVYGQSIDALKEDLSTALDWFEDSPLSSLVKIEKVLAYGNKKRFAELHNAIVTIFKNGNDTSLYHESWHILSQYCMTQSERDELYNELRKLNGTFKEFEEGKSVEFKNSTNLQLEELLAESFRHYMMTGKLLIDNNLTFVHNGNKTKIQSFFDKIIAWIKWHINKLFGIDVSTTNATPIIDKLFEKLKYGDVEDYIARFDVENEEFETLGQSLYYADQSLLDSISVDYLSDEGINKLAEMYIKAEQNVEIVTDKDYEKFYKDYNNDTDNFRDKLYAFVRENNITNTTDGFQHEATYKDQELSFSSQDKGLYGISESMSTDVMDRMKHLYVSYVKEKANKLQRGFLQVLIMQDSITDFFANWLPAKINSDSYVESLLTRRDENINEFIKANITFDQQNIEGNVLGLWKPFVDYMNSELKDMPFEIDEIISDEDSGSENYKMRDDIKRGDNDRSQKEYLKGQVKFILSLLQKVEGSLSFKQRMNALTNRIQILVSNCNGPEDFYKRILKYRNDEYLSQIIDIIGYPPISQEDFDNLSEDVRNELKDKNVVYDKNASVKHSQSDNDRVFAWNLFAISFNQSNQVAVLSKVNIKEEYVEKPTVFNSWAEDDYDDNPNYSWEEGDVMPDSTESEQEPQVKKRYVFNFSIKTEDEQDKEVVDYINNSLVNSESEKTEYESLGINFNIEKNGLASVLKIIITQKNKFIELQELLNNNYNEFRRSFSQYNNVENCIKFFKSLGITIKNNEVANEVFTKYGSSIVANIISNIIDNPSFKGEYAVDIATITNLRKIITGINFARLAKVVKSQIDIFSSFAAYNGEKNLSNRNAMNSYMTQISKIINDDEFQEIMNSNKSNTSKRKKLIDKFPYIKSFIESPYFDIAFKQGTYLYKLTHQESAVIRNNGLSILRNDTFKNGSVPFEMEQNLKIISNIYNALTANIYTPLQWADKEPALSLLAIDNEGYFVEPISDFTDSNILNVLIPFIDAEIQRIRQVRKYADNPSLYFNGDRTYLKSGLNVSFIDEILGDTQLAENLISSNGTVDNYLNNNADVRIKLEKNISDYFHKEADNYFKQLDEESKKVIFKVGGANITSANRTKVNGTPIESMVYSFVVSNFIVGINQSILLTGDMNIYDNFSKRIGPVISTGELHENDGFLKIALDETNIVEGKNNSYAEQKGFLATGNEYLSTRDYDRVVVTDDPITTTKFKQSMYDYELVDKNSYTDMETANAIGYITFDSYKRRLQKNSKWTKEQDKLYYKIINGEEVSLQDVKKHFQPLKYQYAAPIRNASMDQRALLKNMYFPLIPTAIEGTGLQQLHDMMVKEGIDMITVKNGSKLNDKTDHQGQHTSLFRFGIVDDKLNDKVLSDSIRYVNIYLSTNGTDVVKGNGHSAIEKLKIDGKVYDDTEVIYTDTKLEDNPEQTLVLKVVRTDGKVTGLVRCKVDSNTLVELDGNNTCTIDDKTKKFMFDGNAVSISDNSFEVESKFMRDQLVIHNEEGETIAIQTQLMSEATMNIFDAGQVLGSTEEEKKMNKDAVDSFEGSFKALYNYHLNRVMSKICVLDDNGNIRKEKDKDGKEHYVIDQDKVLAMIKKEADMSSDIPQVVYEGLTRENIMDKLNNSTYSSVLMKLLLGRISKDITKIKVFGDNLKQAPDLLTEQYYNTETLDGFIDSILKSNSFDEVKVSVDGVTLNNPSTKNNNGMVFESDGSNFYNLPEDAAEYQRLNPAKAQVTFSKDFFFLKDHPVVINYCQEKYNDISRLENASQLCKIVNECIAEGLFKDEPNLFKLVGVRIPTQGYNFMDFMEVGRFIDPALGPMIILPKEMVEKNGSDYDVDSMPIMFPHITSYASFDKDGNVIRKVEFTTSDTASRLNDVLDEVKAKIKEIDKVEKTKKNSVVSKHKSFDDYFNWFVETLLGKQSDYNVLNLTKDEFNRLTNNGKNFILLRNQISIINKSLNRTKKNLGISNGCKQTLKTELLVLFNASNYTDYSNAVNSLIQTINNDVSGGIDISKLRQLTGLKKELERQIRNIEQHYLENNLMLSIYNLLSLPINRKSLLKKSDTHLFTESKVGMYNEYLADGEEAQSPKKFGSILNDTLDEKELSSMDKIGSVYNEFVRNSNNVSMTALGIAAVAAKWSVIWSRLGAKMKQSFRYKGTNYQTMLLLQHNVIDSAISLGNITMQDGLSKSEVHDELISGFVDGAKDPWPASLGFNIQTIPVVEFMVWAGCKRDDIISLVNFNSIKNYVSKWQSYNKGLTRYIGDATGYEDKTGKSVFFKNTTGIISENLRKTYEDLYNNSQKDSRPSFEAFAYAVLQNVIGVNSKDLAANSIISNGKKSKFEKTYKALFENMNDNVKLSSNKIIVNNKEVQLKFNEISYKDFAVLQYMMLEKMSNDITNFTTKMESDKNVFKTTAELEEYKELKRDSETKESTFDYNFWMGELKHTNMGVRFYNDEVDALIKDIMLTNGNTEISSWRFNEKLNKLIYDIISKTINGEKLSDNMDYAKDKIFEYFYQNEFARRNIYNNREVSGNATEKELAQKHGGYFVEYVNGIKTYVYDYTMMFEMYQTQKGTFSCFQEFLNFVFKRDNIHNTLQKQAMTIISESKTEQGINGKDLEYYERIETNLTGDILYDSIMTIMFNKSRVNNKVYKDNVGILLSSVFETYCYIRSCLEICNYQALFNTKAFGDDSLTYADLVNNILNGNSVLLETFPMLANLFMVSNWKGCNYIKLTKALDNNTSNDQYGDETKQVMDALISNHGITNVGILINALSEQERRTKGELNSNDNIRINNKAKSISWIFSLFQNYCLLQSGNGISGKYGIAKFGDDEYRAMITRKAVTEFVKRIDNNDNDAIEQLNYILRFKTGNIPGVPQQTEEKFNLRDFSGENYVDEAYMSSVSNISNPIVVQMTGKMKNRWKAKQYSLISTKKNSVYILDEENKIYSSREDYDLFIPMIAEYLLNNPDQQIFDTIKVVDTTKNEEYVYIYLFGNYIKIAYTQTQGESIPKYSYYEEYSYKTSEVDHKQVEKLASKIGILNVDVTKFEIKNYLKDNLVQKYKDQLNDKKQYINTNFDNLFSVISIEEYIDAYLNSNERDTYIDNLIQSATTYLSFSIPGTNELLGVLTSESSTDEQIRKAIILFRETNNYQKFGLANKNLDVNNLTQLDYPTDVLTKYLEKFTTDNQSDKEISDSAKMALDILQEKAGTYELYKLDNNSVGGSVRNGERFTLSISGGNSIDIIKDTNSKGEVLFKFDSQGPKGNASQKKFSKPSQELISILIGGSTNNIKYETITDKNLIETLSEQIKKVDSKQNAILINGDDIFVKFANTFYKVSKNTMAETNNIKPFINNIFYVDSDDIYSGDFKLGGFKVAESVEQLMYYVGSTNDNILITSSVKDQIMNDENSLFYLSNIFKLDLTETGFEYDKSDKSVIESNNCK